MTYLRTMVLVAALGLVGCVTTEVTGDAPPVANPKEAAQINQELGIAYLRQGNYEQARAKLEKAVDEDPNLATAHSALGLVYERLGAIDEADSRVFDPAELLPNRCVNRRKSFAVNVPAAGNLTHGFLSRGGSSLSAVV